MLQRVMVSAAVELANEEPFAIGDLYVEPAHLRVSRRDDMHTVEPRVMQVLVVLGQARGRVVSRGELVERCWDGRIVGENAIQRIISRLRYLGDTTAAFEVETVTKVGYVLRSTDACGTISADAGPGEEFQAFSSAVSMPGQP